MAHYLHRLESSKIRVRAITTKGIFFLLQNISGYSLT